MKTNLLSLILLGLLNLISIQAMPMWHYDIPNQVVEKDLPSNEEIIELKGDLLLGAGPNAIEAFLSHDCVCVRFNQNFGQVSITLLADSGLIYSNTVNTAICQFVNIPLNDAPCGCYTLLLENANGDVEGNFER